MSFAFIIVKNLRLRLNKTTERKVMGKGYGRSRELSSREFWSLQQEKTPAKLVKKERS